MSNEANLPLLHVGRPNVGNMELFNQYVAEIFERRWFTNNGPLVQQLEKKLAAYLEVEHCVLVCNGTVGLQIACHALELTGEVILPAFTFVATAHALRWERLVPVFADVAPTTHSLDPESVRRKITSRTSAILGVHLWGSPCDTQAIGELAEKYGLIAMYDAAHAFGCRHRGRMIGNFGRCEVFSFHATKFFSTFEGGAITTNDGALANKIRLMRNFGFSGMDRVVHLGTNGKMPEICAAMGLANLESVNEFLAANRRNFERYQSRLNRLPGVKVFDAGNARCVNYQYAVIQINPHEFGATRDQLWQHLMNKGIRARRYFYPGCHRMEPYASSYPHYSGGLAVTDRLCESVLVLPSGASARVVDVDRVCDAVNDCQVSQGRIPHRRLSRVRPMHIKYVQRRSLH